MDQNLQYLHEVLSNYTENHQAVLDIDQNMMEQGYSSEEMFVRNLTEEQSRILREIISKEMNHANESGDFERGYQLNRVFEILY
ncbi:sigma-G-dependent sporulation-specific acid-soluble spore protein CsgA [Radiobacillus kanasensis]|uniref:sigma-G-dependent sporulation-specific acid-soluble spore protein CsgA n=1 Tax=Radiobacillus kanasensis TaxID=2844358 RepID=UPI001E40EE58|nr:sigma-G-dependent sporulation-specific acid-soluble spore protein CsgA [Radiobacillus kanasensis]UFU01195.1 sigma-G-dependent sporulation-specific acid-soluble spore protein CsgA [Radiobacillus kanasensis]